ncbi:MAG: hypothetical protein WKG00_17525 [Polyangiaceae bacterium]
MREVFWLIPDRVAGRPGPDRVPWDLAAMRDAGIGAVLSVNDGLLCHPEDFASVGIEYACIIDATSAQSSMSAWSHGAGWAQRSRLSVIAAHVRSAAVSGVALPSLPEPSPHATNARALARPRARCRAVKAARTANADEVRMYAR